MRSRFLRFFLRVLRFFVVDSLRSRSCRKRRPETMKTRHVVTNLFVTTWMFSEEKIMSGNQRIGVWLLCSLLLALALYRWFNLP